ncbi:MAG TPA: hypothetical protein ENK92_03115, partial [Bacteroidetes bacterium]|nr:hypothetical protein [Bacteroidota bacterium]
MFRIILSILIFICIILYTINTFFLQGKNTENIIEVLLVTQSNVNLIGQNVKAAYESVLEEEGVPFKWITHGDLWRKTPAEALKYNNTIIFPDYLTQNIPFEFSVWVEDFVDLGGNVFIVYNCGTMHKNGSYREKAVFTRLLGLNYITYNKYKSLAFQMANVRLKDKSSVDFLELPLGKLDQLSTITGYQYGKLSYPVAKVDVNHVDNKDILVYSVYEDGKILPNTFRKKSGLGNVMFANLALGYLKAYGTDDLILRSYLRAFLFKTSSIPHLDRAPYHKGGIVLNWHIDDWRERTNFYIYQKNGIIRKNLHQSIHITAGDYLFEPGDTLGFNAAKYPYVVRDMIKFGTIGSHGGWAHNWFTTQLKKNKLTNDQLAYYVDINNKVLSLITNYDIREYAAPTGIHIQPFLTKHLEKRNFLAYYYPGDLGSVPNRTFFKGKMVSEKVIAFPVMPYREIVSVQEFADNNISASE